MPQVAHAESRTRLWRAGWPNRTRFRSVVAAITAVVLAAGLAAAWSPAQAAVTQSASCLDGDGVRWRSRVIWGGVYQAADGSLRVVLDYVGWTTSKAGTVRTDSVVRTYDGAGVRVQKLKWTGGFDYGLGTVYQVRNPTDPVSAPGRANVTVSLGVDGDWFRNCTVTFTQPSTSSAPAPTPTPTTTPIPTPTPTRTPTPTSTACIGQTITPFIDVQAAVNNAPTGTTFCFGPGTYNIAITPKSGQIFDGGNQAAILDGQNTRQYAFRAANTSNVTIRGFVVQHYNTPLQAGAIHAFGTTGWKIEQNHITLNAASGVATDTGAKVLNNLIDHNGQQGYAAHGENILYEGNEIAYNNENLTVDATWEAGGGKSWATRYAVFRNNNVHHNGGNGMWDDTNNIYITYDNNTVANNWGAGIYHEIGYDAKITDNTVTNNGTSTSQGGGQEHGWLWNAGIQLRSSGAVSAAAPILVTGNTVTNNFNGIALLDSPAVGCPNTNLNEGAYGPCRIQNILVQNNVVTMKEGATGVVQDGSGNGVFTSQNVRFQNNTYHVSTTTHPYDGHAYDWFAWNNSWPDWTAWKTSGNDTGGSFNP